jgi:hypothetical protein
VRIICAFALLLASCGSKKEMMPPPGPPAITIDNLCSELARVDCDRLMSCGSLMPPVDKAACQLRQTAVVCAPYAAALKSSISGGEATFVQLAASTCRDKVSMLGCSVGIDHDFFSIPECKGVVTGMSGVGGHCTLPSSCTTGLVCRSLMACPGTCQAIHQNNDSCADGVPCADGLFCSQLEMRCHAQAPLDQPCEISENGNSCANGAFCDSSQPGVAKCAPVRGKGNGCLSPYECATGLSCVNNLCSGGMLHDACMTDADCGAGLGCALESCEMFVGQGQPCLSAPCAEGLTCTSSGTRTGCTVDGKIGDACNPITKPCYLGRCVSGACAAAVADGDACMFKPDCLPGRSCTNGHCAAPQPACAGG